MNFFGLNGVVISIEPRTLNNGTPCIRVLLDNTDENWRGETTVSTFCLEVFGKGKDKLGTARPGEFIEVKGKLRSKAWREDRYILEAMPDDIQFQNIGAGKAQPTSNARGGVSTKPAAVTGDDWLDDSIPF